MKIQFLRSLAVLSLAACSTAPEQNSTPPVAAEQAAAIPVAVYQARDTALLPSAIRRQKEIWQEAFDNMDVQTLQACYWESAGLLLSREFSQDPEEITQDFIKIRSMLGTIRYQDVFSVVPHGEDNYFEMGFCRIVSDDGAFPYVYVNAWKKIEDQWQIEMQALAEQKAQPADLEEIDRARELWQERSNAHDHQTLVAASYSPAGYYFNQGRIHKGTAAISEVYSYMSRPGWQITLTPISVLPASPDVVLELGQYQSGGTGHYLIIWEKQDDGEWQVLLDFNF